MGLLRRRNGDDRVVRRGGRRGERGMAYVETVFVLPVVLMLILGLADFSFVLKHYLVAGNAASEAARTAALFQTPCDANAAETAAENVATGLLQAGGIETGQIVDIDAYHSNEAAGDTLCNRGMVVAEVEVRHELRFLNGLFPLAGFGPFDVTATATTQNENQN
jgi:hypothetical protein